MEKEVIILLAIILFLAALGQMWIALFVGVAGALVIAASARLGEPRHFEPVNVPPPGKYPDYNFWKSLLESSGTMIGAILKTATKVDKAIDKWGDFWKANVWKSKSAPDEYMIPGLWKMDKKQHKKMLKLSVLDTKAEYIQNQIKSLIVLSRSVAPEEKKKIMDKILELMKELKEIQKEMEETIGKD